MPRSEDPDALAHGAENLRIAGTTPEQNRAAALAICDIAGNPHDALTPLAALSLIDPLTPLPNDPGIGQDHRNRAATATHGTASGLSWHRRTRVPLCMQCRAWAARNENGAR